jgi:NADH-quinone oxidoreductase chain G
MAKITVNGNELEVPDGTVLLEACRQAGIEIPNFCYYPKLTLLGACRMCLVEIEKMPKPQTACTTIVRDGMVVRTDTPAVEKMRSAQLEFILLNHSLTCPTCDAGGECELQDNTLAYRAGHSRLADAKINRNVTSLGPFIDKNMERCLWCARCVRYCDEIMGVKALGMHYRGARMEIASFLDQPLDCVLCGNCVEVCPVGALTSNLFDYKARPWERVQSRTICTYCGDGCSMTMEVKENRIFRTRAFLESGILISDYRGVNDEFLCVRGRFGYQFLNHPDRLTTPLVRKDGELRDASWDEAIAAVAAGLKEALGSGPDAVGFIGSERCTNEADYLFGKLARAVVGTNNVDARVGYKNPPPVRPLANSTPTLRGLRNAPAVLVIGANPSDENPLTETEIRMCVRRNQGRLAVADSRYSLLVEDAQQFLRCKPGTEAAMAAGLMRAMFDAKGLAVPDSLAGAISRWDGAATEAATGVAAAEVAAAAADLAQAAHVQILYGSALLCSPGADAAVPAIYAAASALGWPAPLELVPFNNSRGALDMGLAPDLLPGYLNVADADSRSQVGGAWAASLPAQPGMSTRQMLEAAAQGRIKALYVMGSNPAVAFPDGRLVSEALEKVGFLVVQDLFLSETARYADVVLPACAFAEQDGTYTNIEGRVQRTFKAMDPPGEAWPDTVIISHVARALGADWNVGRPEPVLAEIASVCPIYAGITADLLHGEGIAWPGANGAPLAVHGPIPPVQPPAPSAPAEYPLILTTGQFLFHSGTLSTWASGLRLAAPIPFVQVNVEDSEPLGLADGDMAVVESPRGRLELTVKVTDKVAPGSVFVPINFPEARANELMDCNAPVDYVRIAKKL